MCNCSCVFCVAGYSDSLAGINLKYEGKEPEFFDFKACIDSLDLNIYKEITFCGFGEPTLRFDIIYELAKYIKNLQSNIIVRLNTNGLGDLVNKFDVFERLKPYVDRVSISLNAQNAEVYSQLSRPAYESEVAYKAVIFSIKRAIELGYETQATVVYGPELDTIDIAECKKICHSLGAAFRIRPF